MARVVAVNVGVVRNVAYRGKIRPTGIFKYPVPGRVALRHEGVAGDQQADRKNHGGPKKAVYAYGVEDGLWWQDKLRVPLSPGVFGENLTVVGVAINEAVIGERWKVGDALLQVVQPRFPCWKLGVRMDDPSFPDRFLAAGRAGAYLSVVEEAEVEQGDRVERLAPPGHGITVGLMAHLNHGDRHLALRLLERIESGIGPGELQDLLAEAGVS